MGHPRLQACLREGECPPHPGHPGEPGRVSPIPTPRPRLVLVPSQSGAWPVSAGAAVTRTQPRSASPTKSTSPPRTTSPPLPAWHPPPLATPAWVGERGLGDRERGGRGVSSPLTPSPPRSVGAGAAVRRGGRAVGGGAARLGQCLPQHVGGLRAVAAGRAAGRQGQPRPPSGPRDALAGAQGPHPGGEELVECGRGHGCTHHPPGWMGFAGGRVVGAPQPCVGADPRAQRNPLGGCGGSGGFTSRCLCHPPQVSGEKKQVGSTAGMQTSVDTSPLLKVRGNGPDPALGKLPASCLQAGFGVLFLSEGGVSLCWRAWRGAGGGCSCGAIRVKPKGGCHRIGVTVTHLPRQHRAEAVVPERLALMMRHIRERDFEGFGQLAMRDSNQFHATCLDTFPPIFYLNDLSRHIIALAHRFNTHHGRTKVPAGRAGPTGLLVCCGAAV